MRPRTLTETLLAEEPVGEYRTYRYDKTATAYMFGYACSSGFGGSGFGKDFGIGTGFVTELDIGDDDSLLQRLRADRGHGPLGPHLNFELFPNPVRPNSEGKILPLTNDHLPFGWKK